MKLSIVSTLYRSAPYIHELVTRLESAVSGLVGVELTSVGDGSLDNSFEPLQNYRHAAQFGEIAERLEPICLSRRLSYLVAAHSPND